MKENSYPSFEHLPVSLNAEDISQVLNISIGNAYNLLHREDFPTIHIGKRMIVPPRPLLRVDGSPDQRVKRKVPPGQNPAGRKEKTCENLLI